MENEEAPNGKEAPSRGFDFNQILCFDGVCDEQPQHHHNNKQTNSSS